jgi:hypothetical protein
MIFVLILTLLISCFAREFWVIDRSLEHSMSLVLLRRTRMRQTKLSVFSIQLFPSTLSQFFSVFTDSIQWTGCGSAWRDESMSRGDVQLHAISTYHVVGDSISMFKGCLVMSARQRGSFLQVSLWVRLDTSSYMYGIALF